MILTVGLWFKKLRTAVCYQNSLSSVPGMYFSSDFIGSLWKNNAHLSVSFRINKNDQETLFHN